jgi:hypothetical protein
MRTLTVLGILLVFSSFCFCQDCKFYKKEFFDQISELPVLVQKHQKTINKTGSLSVEFYYTTNRCWILLNLRIERWLLAREMTFNSKTPIVFTFNDSSELQLLPSKEYLLDASSNFGGLFTSTQYNYAIYDISKENVGILASKEIQRIRINYSLSNEDGEIVDSAAYKENKPSNYGKKIIQFSSSCILGVDFLDPNICQKHSLKSNSLDTIAKLSKEQLLEIIQSGKIDFTLVPNQNFDEIQIGDIVAFKTVNDDWIFGIVVEKNGKNLVKIKTYPISGTAMVVEMDFQKIFKTFLIK